MRTGKLTKSEEDYLEAIAFLKEKGDVVRVKDISDALGVRKPSVVGALRGLKSKDLIVQEAYGSVDLTKSGAVLANGIKKRHDLLLTFLTRVLAVDRKTAEADACRLEHVVSKKTIAQLTKFVAFMNACPESKRTKCIESFQGYGK